MKRTLSVATLIPLLCNPAYAVELGPVRINSYLNEPLQAIIALNDVSVIELADIKFSLAGYDVYRRFDLQRPGGLQSASFKISAAENGSYELHITTRQRMVEPILNIIVQVNEKQGDFFKQYALLIDPVQDKIAQPLPQVVEAKTVSAPRAARPQEQAPASAAEKPVTLPPGTLLVRNRSISIIAQDSKLHDKYSVYQIMRAFYLANPGAFLRGNINKLASGSRLVIPDESVVAEVPRQKAVNFVYSVSRDEPSSQPKGSLAKKPNVVEPPADSKSLSPSAATGDTIVETDGMIDEQSRAAPLPEDRVADLVQHVDRHESQIQLLTQKIEQLRVPPAATADEPAMHDASAIPPLVMLPQPVIQSEDLAAASATLSSEIESPALNFTGPMLPKPVALAASPEQEPRPKTPQPAAIIQSAPPAVDAGLSRWWLLVFVAVVMLFALREWMWRRRMRQVDASLANKPNTYAPSKNPEEMGTLELRHLESRNRKKKSRQQETPNKSTLRLESSTPGAVKIEIEVLLAYEQYEEALQLLTLSREKFGEADWIYQKTLEIYAATQQCEEFLALFNEKRAMLEAASPIAWSKVEKMRDQLCEKFNISAIG